MTWKAVSKNRGFGEEEDVVEEEEAEQPAPAMEPPGRE
jgi:hypothetical protein